MMHSILLQLSSISKLSYWKHQSTKTNKQNKCIGETIFEPSSTENTHEKKERTKGKPTRLKSVQITHSIHKQIKTTNAAGVLPFRFISVHSVSYSGNRTTKTWMDGWGKKRVNMINNIDGKKQIKYKFLAESASRDASQ